MTTPAEVLLAQAQSQLARQETKLNAYRATSGTLLATGGLVAGLLATRLRSSMSVAGFTFAVLAAAAFLLNTAAAVKVLAPTDTYHFAESLGAYQEWLDHHGSEPGADVSFVLGMARNLDAARAANEHPLGNVAKMLVVAAVLLGAQVALWVMAALVA